MCDNAFTGQLQVILLHGREPEGDSVGGRRLSNAAGGVPAHPHTHVLDYFLRLRTGELKKLLFPKQPKQASAVLQLAVGACFALQPHWVPGKHSGSTNV